MQKTQQCPLGIDESTWKAERGVLASKEAVEEAKADLKAVCTSYPGTDVQGTVHDCQVIGRLHQRGV